MKLFIGLLFATLAFNGVLSLPARNPSDDAEVIGGPRRVSTRTDDAADDEGDFTNFKGVVDTGSGYPFLQPNPSVIRVGFFDSFDDIFRRFSDRLFPSSLFGGRGVDDDSDDESSDEVGFPAFDTKKANTTSTVKVVDGHKVEVNETVYGDENSVFKVRVVNIRPLEDGETVVESVNTNKANDNGDNIKPVTSAPASKNPNAETDDSDERREPLEKRPTENEIQGNIDDPEHSIAKNENIVETTTAAAIDNTMLPTTEDINGAFVTDNSLEEEQALAEEELNANENNNNNDDDGNGNNEFETNMSEDNNNSNSSSNSDSDNDNVDNVENPEAEHTIENNENTEEEVNDNLNESSSTNDNDAEDNMKKTEAENDDDDDEDAEIVNSNYAAAPSVAAIRNKEREDESSSDDEDANADAVAEMHPTFNDEWGSFSNEQNNENNDLSNDIDGYDTIPIDLSNDIAVNDAADLPINPDAEFIDVYGVQHQSNSMPKFEKLSLNYPATVPSEEDWSHTPSK